MSDKVSICNMALSHLGVSTEIQNFDTDHSKEAQACRRFFDTARDKTLRDFAWPFATVFETLAQVGAVNPTVEWAYSYRYPSGALAIRRIMNGSAARNDTLTTRVAFREGRDASGRLIYTDQSPAQIEYTFAETDTERFPPDFVLAFSFYLAFLMAVRITQGGATGLALRKDNFAYYRQALSEAKTAAANEEVPDQPNEAEIIRVRNS